MAGLVVDCNREEMVCLGCDQGIQEGNSTIVLVTFNSKLYCWINAIDMVQKYLFIGLLLNDPSVIHIPEPIPRVWEQTIVLLFQNVPCPSWLHLDLPDNPLELLQPVHKTYFGKRSKYCVDRTKKFNVILSWQYCSVQQSVIMFQQILFCS